MADKSHTEERLVVVGGGGVGKTALYFQFLRVVTCQMIFLENTVF